ncbi:hypothetical protein CRUP_035437 [Coryphaenoides rupestris]|nr:hypothetical protein CRUP_035437 [Coryphaenoides rupestris]
MDNAGYSHTGSTTSSSFEGVHRVSDDDDEMVDIGGATLDFSSADNDDPPLSSAHLLPPNEQRSEIALTIRADGRTDGRTSSRFTEQTPPPPPHPLGQSHATSALSQPITAVHI